MEASLKSSLVNILHALHLSLLLLHDLAVLHLRLLLLDALIFEATFFFRVVRGDLIWINVNYMLNATLFASISEIRGGIFIYDCSFLLWY